MVWPGGGIREAADSVAARLLKSIPQGLKPRCYWVVVWHD